VNSSDRRWNPNLFFVFFQEESHDPNDLDIHTQIYFCAMLILPIIIFVAGKITFFVGETVRIV